MKTLTLVSAGKRQAARHELEKLERADTHPRASLYGRTLNTDLLDELFLENVTAWRRILYKRLPITIAQLIEAFLVKSRYDVVISWAEHLGLPFALLLKLTGSRTPHVAIWSWISKKKKAEFLRRVQSHVDRIILMSSLQRDFAVTQLRIPEDKVVLLRWPVDQKFWRPMDSTKDMICAVGREMRDYETLIRALRDVPTIPCHIAAGAFAGKKDAWIDAIENAGPLPAHITIAPRNYLELRALYARSKFVVIPLLPTDTDNGTTSILEAMAMGKAVICSRVNGQRDVLQEGKTGLFVSPRQPGELRNAIETLWNNPDLAERMGREGRAWVEQHHTLDSWVNNVHRIVSEASATRGNREPDVSRKHAGPTGGAKGPLYLEHERQ